VHHHFPTKATMTAAVARRYGDRFLAESLGARMRAPEMPSPWDPLAPVVGSAQGLAFYAEEGAGVRLQFAMPVH
jgi:hypothetical protein